MLDRSRRREMDRIWEKNLRNWTANKTIGGTALRLLEGHPRTREERDFQEAKEYTTRRMGSDEWMSGVVDQNMCEISMLVVELIRFCGVRDTNTAIWEAAVLAQSLANFRQSEKTDTEKSMPLPRFLSEMHECCDHNVVGHTLIEVMLSINPIPTPEEREFFDDLQKRGLDEIIYDCEMVDLHLTFLYHLCDEARMRAYLVHPQLAFQSSFSLMALYYGLSKKLSISLDSAEFDNNKQRAARKPTKKQSEVIADLRKELSEVKRIADANEKAHLKDMQIYQHATDLKISDLEKKIRQQEEELQAFRIAEEVEGKIEEMEDDLLELPATGITFVGGHPRLIDRLKGKYPDWQYIEAGDTTSEVHENNVTFLFTTHLSHKNDRRVEKQVKRGDYFRITCGNNLGLVLRQLQYFYTLHERRGNGED